MLENNQSYYLEGDNITVGCSNINEKPNYRSSNTIWSNSDGSVIGLMTLSFIATKDHNGLYNCSVQGVPDIPAKFFEIVVHCK